MKTHDEVKALDRQFENARRELRQLVRAGAIVLHWRDTHCAVITRTDTGKRATYWPRRGTVMLANRAYSRGLNVVAMYDLLA